MKAKKCQYCGEIFTPKGNPKQKFCKAACRIMDNEPYVSRETLQRALDKGRAEYDKVFNTINNMFSELYLSLDYKNSGIYGKNKVRLAFVEANKEKLSPLWKKERVLYLRNKRLFWALDNKKERRFKNDKTKHA